MFLAKYTEPLQSEAPAARGTRHAEAHDNLTVMMNRNASHTDSSLTIIDVRVNGRAVRVPAGASVAAAILQADVPFHQSVSGEPRSALCGMGICEECRATVDGVNHMRTCQRLATDGMEIVTE